MRIARAALAAAIFIYAGAAFAATIELKTGEKLEGAIVEETDTTVVLQHLVFGRLVIPKSDIKKPEEEEVRPGLFGTAVLRGWKKSLSAGISGAAGKAKDTQINADMNLNRETERHRGQFVARYFYARSSGSTSDNQFDTRYTHDFLIPDAKWFPFITANYRFDKEQLWAHRLSSQAGVGYDFLKSDEWEVIGRIGAGMSQTLSDQRDNNSNEDDPIRTEPNALLALQTLWNYTEGQSLMFNTLFLPNVQTLLEWRSESRAEWKIAAGFVDGLAFKLGSSFIYDTQEQGGNRRDLRYYGNIVYDF